MWCLSVLVTRAPCLTWPFEGNSNLTTSSASCLGTTGGICPTLRIVYVQMASSALSAGNADFLVSLWSWEAWEQILLVKSKTKVICLLFSMYFVTRFPAPIVQQLHNLFTCPFAADVLPETFFIPPSHPLLDRAPADPWLFCLNFCTPKQWFCISWVAHTYLCFPFIFCIWAQSWVYLCWSSDLVAQPPAQWNKPS